MIVLGLPGLGSVYHPDQKVEIVAVVVDVVDVDAEDVEDDPYSTHRHLKNLTQE